MKMKKIIIGGLLVTGLVAKSFAGVFNPIVVSDKAVESYFTKLLPNTTIDKIYSTPYPNTYALILGQGVVYGNTSSTYLMAGHMFNVHDQSDLTDVLVKLNTPKIDISKIDVSDAVVSKASTKTNKKIIVFSDPDCPYCRQLETEIYERGLDKKLNIYYILMPLPMHPNAKQHAANIICSENQIDTLKQYMVDNNSDPLFKLKQGCNIEAVLERTGSTARNLGINGTPAIITGDGTMIMGADIEAIAAYADSKQK